MDDQQKEGDFGESNSKYGILEVDQAFNEFLLDEVDGHIQENLEDDVVQEALQKGVDLREYSKQIEKELQEVENASIQDYMKESQNIASLHKQITTCDAILETMEGMLHTFQTDLGSISSEIQSLQEQSITMNVKLKNRQSVRGELSQFVDEMCIPEFLVNTIMDTDVSERHFLEQLHELHHKIGFVKQQSFNEAKSCLDVRDVLEKLKHKAIAKVREYLLLKIYQIRKPGHNYQMTQNTILKSRFFYEFLLASERNVAKEVRDEYIDTTSKVYYTYFRNYISKIMKLQYEEQADKEDLLGAEDVKKTGLFAVARSMKNRSTLFTVGSRASIIAAADIEAPIIVPHSVPASQKFPFEALFRSQQYALLDNCCREYLFVTDFFLVTGPAAQELFLNIMGKTLTMFLKHVDAYVNECYDTIALFLCVHVVFRYQVLMKKRDVSALDRYWETVLEILWPRLEHVLQLNINSVRDIDPSKFDQALDTRPHYITRRYAEFSAAIASINESFPSEKVDRLMSALQNEVQGCCLKMAGEFADRKQQLVFLINNYDMMLSVIQERTQEESKEGESFKELLAAVTSEYVEHVLRPDFGGLVAFVKSVEAQVERGATADVLRREEGRVQTIVKQFGATWKKSIEDLNTEVMRTFTNFKNGTQILQASLTQLIQYYHRFQKILGLDPFNKMAVVKSDLINIHHVMVEVKKHRPTF